MSLRLFLVAIVAAFLFGCASAPSGDEVAANAPDAAKAESEEPKRRCRREPNTGFRLGNGRVCKTVAE